MWKQVTLALVLSPITVVTALPPTSIDTGGYTGLYEIYRGPQKIGRFSGNQNLALSSGDYIWSNLTDRFSFHIDANGYVTSDRTDSGVGGIGRLTLNAVEIAVDPGQYDRFYLPYAGGRRMGASTWKVIVGLDERFLNRTLIEITRFRVDAAGRIDLVTGSPSVDVTPGSMVFRNVGFEIDPQAYRRPYQVCCGRQQVGSATFTAIPGVAEDILNGENKVIAKFVVDGAGAVVLLSGEDSASVLRNQIRFENATVQVEPHKYTGLYEAYGAGPIRGASTFVTIPGVEDRLVNGSGQTIARWIAQADGSLHLLDGEDSVELGRAGAIRLKNKFVQVTARDPEMRYAFASGTWKTGANREVMIPFVSDRFMFGSESKTVTVLDGRIQIDNVIAQPNSIVVNAAEGSMASSELSSDSAFVFSLASEDERGLAGQSGVVGCGKSAVASDAAVAEAIKYGALEFLLNSPFAWALIALLFRGFSRFRPFARASRQNAA